MIASGAGVGVLPCFLAADDDALVRVRLDQTIGRSFWLAFHRDVAPQPRIRAFIDWLDAVVQTGLGLLVPGCGTVRGPFGREEQGGWGNERGGMCGYGWAQSS